jgi:hypothetical protein
MRETNKETLRCILPIHPSGSNTNGAAFATLPLGLLQQ